ncbi:MAG: FtsW/RodA/SpoVE family cell cycle protein [Lentisphaeria bacterium]|nr:FtsW/RodA/SpoVE family cell cycle protein [Lentisphaeria bacterium]
MKISLRGTVIFAMVLLSFFGLLTILSSQSEASAPYYLVMRQLISFAAAVLLMLLCSVLPFSFFRRNAMIFAGGFLLAVLILPFFGTRINGMCGWFRYGTFSLQPTEIAKAFFLLGLISVIKNFKKEWSSFTAALGYTVLWSGAILIQPDFGTAFIYIATFMLVIFISGIRWRWMAGMIMMAAAAIVCFIKSHPYAIKRLGAFLNPHESWHLQQLELAGARGGWFGSKLGQALWSNAYVPLPYNDSAYATLTETIGFAGAVLVLILFVILLAALSGMAVKRTLSENARLFIAGSVVLIGVQTLLHIGVNLSLLPPTGLTLPLISYGGSSLVGCGILLGIAMSASKEGNEKIDR